MSKILLHTIKLRVSHCIDIDLSGVRINNHHRGGILAHMAEIELESVYNSARYTARMPAKSSKESLDSTISSFVSFPEPCFYEILLAGTGLTRKNTEHFGIIPLCEERRTNNSCIYIRYAYTDSGVGIPIP